jgi:hypothetical protein
VAVGAGSLEGVSAAPLTGNANTAVGWGALNNIQGAASNNSAFGYNALDSITTGADNVAIGYTALGNI